LYAVDVGRGEESASVLVNPSTNHVRFPHELCESGRSFDPAADAALLERGQQSAVFLGTFETWHAMRCKQSRIGRPTRQRTGRLR
jgi:hypothetical protein